jgi:hypothetical protein
VRWVAARFAATWGARVRARGGGAAQVSVDPIQDLSFGQVLPAVPEVVPPSDVVRRGEIEIRGARSFTLELVLPANMVSATGALLPLSFAPTDATITWLGHNRPPKAFDPGTPQDFRIPKRASGASIQIGGTAIPDPTQPPGSYSATLVIIISNAGN